jgi:hypothetical protein
MHPRWRHLLLLWVCVLPACHLGDSLDGFDDGKSNVDASDAPTKTDSDSPDGTPDALTACEACSGPCMDCDGKPENGCETDTSTSASHCGACNRGCLGGGCGAGACEPVTLASDESSPRALASDGKRVVWVTQATSAANSGAVRTIPLDGGLVAQISAGQSDPVAVALDATFAYFANFSSGGSIARVPVDGGETTMLAIASAPWSIALDEDAVFWTNRQDGSVQSLPKAGGSGVTTIHAEGSFADLRGLTLDEEHAYWVDTGRGEILTAPKQAGAVRTLVSGLNHPVDLALDGDFITWVEAGATWASEACTSADGRVVTAAKADGASARVLAEGQACPASVDTDGIDVVWANRGFGVIMTGSIARVPASGGNVRTLASGVVRAAGVVLLQDSVVWASMGAGPNTGSIAKVAR